MMNSEDEIKQETITVSCPLCPEKHSYALTVRRSLIQAFMSSQSVWQPHKREFTRLFACPTKNQDFQATFTLLEGPLESVSVEEEKLLSTTGRREMNKAPKSPAHNNAGTIEVLKTEAVTPHNKAIYEAGKTILLDSIKTGRDFCQFMITTSTAAIPVYLAIITFLLPKDYKLGVGMGIAIAGPAILFLLAALLFALGYFPVSDYFSLDLIEEIEKARSKIINRRRTFATLSTTVFALATLYAIVVFIINIGAR